jgi:hypothetical protein
MTPFKVQCLPQLPLHRVIIRPVSSQHRHRGSADRSDQSRRRQGAGAQLDDVWASARHDTAVNSADCRAHGWTGRSDAQPCIRSLSVGDLVCTKDGRYFAVGRDIRSL